MTQTYPSQDSSSELISDIMIYMAIALVVVALVFDAYHLLVFFGVPWPTWLPDFFRTGIARILYVALAAFAFEGGLNAAPISNSDEGLVGGFALLVFWVLALMHIVVVAVAYAFG